MKEGENMKLIKRITAYLLTSAHTGSVRNVLSDRDPDPTVRSELLHKLCRSAAEIFSQSPANVAFANDFRLIENFEIKVIAQVDHAEDRLQQVHTIWFSADDMQKQIKFSLGRQIQAAFHGCFLGRIVSVT